MAARNRGIRSQSLTIKTNKKQLFTYKFWFWHDFISYWQSIGPFHIKQSFSSNLNDIDKVLFEYTVFSNRTLLLGCQSTWVIPENPYRIRSKWTKLEIAILNIFSKNRTSLIAILGPIILHTTHLKPHLKTRFTLSTFCMNWNLAIFTIIPILNFFNTSLCQAFKKFQYTYYDKNG